MSAATKGPWPVELTGDGKRYLVGVGLIEGPHGYDVAEVYSDDCDQDEASANANLIAAAPDLFEALDRMVADHEAIQCKPWPSYDAAKAALKKACGEQASA